MSNKHTSPWAIAIPNCDIGQLRNMHDRAMDALYYTNQHPYSKFKYNAIAILDLYFEAIERVIPYGEDKP